MNSEESSVASTLQNYAHALNAANTDAVMNLYAPDAVFMPQGFPSIIGAAQVRRAYDGIFQQIRLTVSFEVHEVHVVAPDWAFARTESAGSVLVRATGHTKAEANQELFVLQKREGVWKIARYCFSTTKPSN